MMYVRFQLSLRTVEDLLHKRGIDISHESVCFWWNRFGPLFAAEIRRYRVQKMRAYSNWQWHLGDGAAEERRGDNVTGFGEAKHWSETQHFDLRVSEVATPRPVDRIEIDGEGGLIQGDPARDPNG